MSRLLNQCHRCAHCAGVRNSQVQCLLNLTVVDRSGGEPCPDQDTSALPGKVLSSEEFKEEVEFIKQNRKP